MYAGEARRQGGADLSRKRVGRFDVDARWRAVLVVVLALSLAVVAGLIVVGCSADRRTTTGGTEPTPSDPKCNIKILCEDPVGNYILPEEIPSDAQVEQDAYRSMEELVKQDR